jgi:hypothetical protein
MKKRTSLITLLWVITSITFAQYPQMEFPLQIGNHWQYVEAPGLIWNTYGYRDTSTSNGNVYMILRGGNVFGGYFRKENSKVYQYYPGRGKEVLLFDFSKKEGDTISYNALSSFYGDSTFIILTSNKIELKYRALRHCMKFVEYAKKESKRYVAIYEVTDSIGITSIYRELLGLNLCGAEIRGKLYGIITDVEGDKLIPVSMTLSQNYPNPFNPSTTINYSIPVETRHAAGVGQVAWSLQHVTLKIYDLLGREAATLVDEYKQPGNYMVQFGVEMLHPAAAGQVATSLPSGVYFYTLCAGGYTITKKMILMK